MELPGWARRLDLLTPTPQDIARTRRSVLSKRFTYMGLGEGGELLWWAGMKLVLSKMKLDPRPENRCLDAGGAVSVK